MIIASTAVIGTTVQDGLSCRELATLFLSDERASHIAGEVLVIDGGWSITSPLSAYLEKELKGK